MGAGEVVRKGVRAAFVPSLSLPSEVEPPSIGAVFTRAVATGCSRRTGKQEVCIREPNVVYGCCSRLGTLAAQAARWVMPAQPTGAQHQSNGLGGGMIAPLWKRWRPTERIVSRCRKEKS